MVIKAAKTLHSFEGEQCKDGYMTYHAKIGRLMNLSHVFSIPCLHLQRLTLGTYAAEEGKEEIGCAEWAQSGTGASPWHFYRHCWQGGPSALSPWGVSACQSSAPASNSFSLG